MHFIEKLNCEIYNDPNYTILMALLTGILFSGISWGIIYVIIFLILWEIAYYAYLNVNEKYWDFLFRVTVILAAFLGFLYGSILHEKDDHYENCNKFKEDINYYGKEFDWFH
jgi:hypothetical protein